MPVKLSQKQAIIVFGGIVLAIIVGVVIFLNMRPAVNNGPSVKLTMWGTDSKDVMGSILSGYAGAQVTYTQVDPAKYDAQLLSALAAGTGPDVFEIANRDLPQWRSALAPEPVALAQKFGVLQLGDTFPDVVSQDFVSGGQIYGLPLSIDTLAMVYNKDLFNSAGIAVPPKTWDDFDTDVTKLRTVNAQGQITQAAAAIGGSEASVPNATDLLSLLMLQNGTQMVNANMTAATFADRQNGGTGLAAFNFYLQFASAVSPYYTWNDGMGNGLDGFVAGKTAIVFAYASDLAAIKAKAPYLNVGIAPMPQPSGASVTINYPKYYGLVAARAGQSAAAWNLIVALAVTSGDGKLYQTDTGAPPALRTDIQADINDPDLSVFAAQALTAKSWYEANATQVDSAFNTAIMNVLTNADDSTDALTQAQAAVTSLM
jgi:ABC-type glycerol-3-phosphate transport system substrate-binding protein